MKIGGQETAFLTDFDGTITTQDTLVFLLERYGEPSWCDIETQMTSGRLTEREGLAREFALLNVSWEEAIGQILREIEIAPGFAEFYSWIQSAGAPFLVISGGIDEICYALLEKHGLNHLKIRANTIKVEDNRWILQPSNRPRIRGLCNHCKSSSVIEVMNRGYHVVFIGDGTTDRCPSTYADTVFAKGALEDFTSSEGIKYTHFDDFFDISRELGKLI